MYTYCIYPSVDLLTQTAPHLAAGPQSPTEQHGNGDCKRQETEAPSGQTASASHLDLNFPLPGEKGPSCLVKVRCVTQLPVNDLSHVKHLF